MVMPIKPTKIECEKCKTMDVFSSPRDMIAFIPRCKKCGGQMTMKGEMTALDWVKVGVNKVLK